ncbi:MAG: acetolactate synthase small subunit [Firmicutes bacterium]|nr:acetolactate synthase small subunit [Bacillota bacterium]
MIKPGVSKHIIVARVDNNPGVVSRISGLFTRRGYNIESFVTCITKRREVYHLTISVISTKDELDLLVRQLGRIMEVITIFTADDVECVSSELMLLKTAAKPEERADIIRLADAMDARIASVRENCVILEVSGGEQKLEGVIKAFEPFGILDMIRSGTIAMNL